MLKRILSLILSVLFGKDFALIYLSLVPVSAIGGQTEIQTTIQEQSQQNSPFIVLPTEIQSLIINQLPTTLGARTASQLVCKYWNSLQSRNAKIIKLENSNELKIQLQFFEETGHHLKRATVPDFDISSNSRFLLIYGANLDIRNHALIWDTSTGNLQSTIQLPANTKQKAWFLPDNRRVAVFDYGDQRRIKIWDSESKAWLDNESTEIGTGSFDLFQLNRAVLFHRKWGHTPRILDLVSKKVTEYPLPEPFDPRSGFVSILGNQALFRSKFGKLEYFHYYDANENNLVPLSMGDYIPPSRITFVKNSNFALVEFKHEESKSHLFPAPALFNLTENKWSNLIRLPDIGYPEKRTILFEPSPDGTRFFVAYNDGKAEIWDTLSSTILSRLSINQNQILAAQFSWNSELLVITESEGKGTLWDVDTGNPLAEIDLTRVLKKRPDGEKTNPIEFAARFFPDDRAILLYTTENDLLVWRP